MTANKFAISNELNIYIDNNIEFVNIYVYILARIVNLLLYNMKTNKLQIQQLDKRIELLSQVLRYPNPVTGWIRAVRSALGMTLQQLADKLSISKQGLSDLELREKEGAITIKSLREIANALDMELVYGLVPKEKSLEKHIDKKARELAKRIVLRTSNTMKLEDQEVSEERLLRAIEERTEILKYELPKSLWD